MTVFTPPGVFRPLRDSRMLAAAVGALTRPGDRVLDVCTGSGVVAVETARAGADQVVAVDLSAAAVLTARFNGILNGGRVQARRGDLYDPVARRRFHLIASNPPYLPATRPPSRRTRGRAVDAGHDGRRFVDRLIDGAPAHLEPGGSLVIVHSSVCGRARTEARMHDAGLEPSILLRHRGPLGPVLRERAPALEERGLLTAGERDEELLVIRGRIG